MKIKFNNCKEFLDKLNTLVYAIVGLPLLLFSVVYLKQKDGKLPAILSSGEYLPYLTGLLVALTLVFLVWGYVFYKKEMKAARETQDLRTKLDKLAQATFKKFILFFISLNLAVLGLLLTAEKYYSGLFVFVLIFISISNPSQHRILRDLRLNKEDGQKILNKEEPIE
ncbi:MAG: hypothetical protein MI784_17045 [Cytophagales bacterium]|nr:hypothetical protein [Cytophagales bacterium]